ncbi:monocarboxylate transporter 13-like isoform X2 [Stylophora pistillata]|uniref:Monocarboxylate transporter 2 n=2 Tax=Stylophora pistillata TaxID=50429 RepID=A0A2B4SKS5_STYPI|nr:monocarboxylate transporter 13-like isoform X2 [Stylophora pistillata]PFX29709.1 Monocarboxylate transporter 2 [Stylophora pistillata]
MAAAGLFGPVAGRLTDCFGARAVVICGSLISATGLMLTSIVPNLNLMLLTYGGIAGFGSSLIYISVFEIVPRYFIKHRSLATGLITMSTGASLVVMSPVCQALVDAFGWRGAFRGMSCLVSIIFFLAWSLDPNVANEEPEVTVKETQLSKPQQTCRILDFSMWENVTFVVLNITSFFVFIGHTIPSVHFGRYSEDLGVSKDLITWLYSCIGLASLLARSLGSKLSDIIGPHKVLLVFGTVDAVAVSVLLPLATNWTWLLCFSIVYGLADGLIAIGSVFSSLETLTQRQKAQGFGFFQSCVCVALLFGAPIGGLVADKTNSYPTAFLCAGGIEAVGVLILLLFICMRRVELSAQMKIQTDSENSSLTELLVIEKETVL